MVVVIYEKGTNQMLNTGKWNKDKWNKCKRLFLTFFKIGAFTFGGGYAMIPLIQKETVEREQWIGENDMLEVLAVAESTPGPVSINIATFVGYHIAGVAGAFCATAGVVVPSFCVVLILSFFLKRFESLKVVKYAFEGIRAGILALLVKTLISMGKQNPKNIFTYLMIGVSFIGAAILDISVLLVIIFCALAGLMISLIPKEGSKNK